MKSKLLLITSLFTILVFTACNKGGKTGLLIPKDAGLVLHIDLSSLSSKLSWDEIAKTSWFAEAQKKTSDTLAKKLLSNPESSGIDTKGSLVMFMKRTGTNGYIAFEGKLKDAAKFSKMILEADKGNIKIEKDGEFNFVKSPENNDGVMYFNDKMFVAIADVSDMNKAMNGMGAPAAKYALDSLKYFAKSTFSLKGDQLLDSDNRFEKLIGSKADMHYWMNSGNLYQGMLGGAMGMLNMMKLSTLLEGNVSTGKVNFENGKIAIESDQFYNKELAGLFKKYSGKEVSSELLGKLPEHNALAAFAMSYSPEGMKEFLKLLGVDGMANAALAQMGFSVDDFIKANKGELAFALTDFEVKESPASVTLEDGEVVPYNKEKPEMKFVFGVSVNDKASFQKIINAIDAKTKAQMDALGDTSASKVKNKLQGNWFALGSSDTEVDAFLNGNNKPAYTAGFSGHNGGGFFDLQKIIMGAAKSNKDSASKKAIDISAAFWKNANMVWDIKGGEAISKFDINLTDGNTNSLKQLNKYFDQLYLAIPKKDIVDDADFTEPAVVDTTTGTMN